MDAESELSARLLDLRQAYRRGEFTPVVTYDLGEIRFTGPLDDESPRCVQGCCGHRTTYDRVQVCCHCYNFLREVGGTSMFDDEGLVNLLAELEDEEAS